MVTIKQERCEAIMSVIGDRSEMKFSELLTALKATRVGQDWEHSLWPRSLKNAVWTLITEIPGMRVSRDFLGFDRSRGAERSRLMVRRDQKAA
jgi:hypothetical protein